ncbi:MAG: hypothetical protein Q9168_000600 [Polycauliona sp. 1 TL-2023]
MADTTQQLEEDDCITPRQSTVINLQYPSISVTGTPDRWLSRSLIVPMASNQDEGSVRSIDDATSSLGDSTYDFVDDCSYATTDDEEAGLTQRISAEKTDEPSHNDDLERTISTDHAHLPSPQPAEQAARRSSVHSTISDDDITCQHPSELHQFPARGQRMPTSIKFVDIHHGEGAFQLEPTSAPPDLAVTVRQHMLDRTLSLEGPYRLLYIGDAAARERIVSKIGAALTSTDKGETRRPLRYNVVPMPSSDDPECSSEPVLLDWSKHEIVVYQCVSAFFGRRDSGHDTIDLSMDGGTQVQSFWDGSRFNLTKDWELPDIAIFYLSEDDGVSAKRTRRLARSFVARHKIPTMVVTERPAWERPSETITIERLSPHICLQTKTDTTPSPDVIKRLPIDLSTFVRIDALQLNQNLAYLALASGTPRTSSEFGHSSRNGDQGNFGEKLKGQLTWMAVRDHLNAARSGLSNVPALLVVAFICSFIFTQLCSLPVYSISQGLDSVTNRSNALTPPSPLVATPLIPSSSKSKTPQSLTVSSSAKPVPSQRPLAKKSHTDLATLLESSPMTVNKSEKFQVHVLGDAHVVVRPPHWFTRLKKTPKLNINITQNGQTVKHQSSVLFDGLYALEIPIDRAHGVINISVWTNSKPKIHENLQVDFGNSWLRVVGWKKAMDAVSGSFRQDLDLVQSSLAATITRSGADLHSLVKDALGRAKLFKVETQTAHRKSVGRVTNTTNRIFASTRDVSTGLVQVLKQRKGIVSKGMSLEAQRWQRQISSFVSNKTRIARIYAEATPTAYRIQLRNTQKRALRVWWSMTGLPQQRPVNVASKSSPRTSGVRLKKRAFGK